MDLDTFIQEQLEDYRLLHKAYSDIQRLEARIARRKVDMLAHLLTEVIHREGVLVNERDTRNVEQQSMDGLRKRGDWK